MTKIGFNKRRFASVGMIISLIVLPVSGLFCHEQSSGPLTSEKHIWMSLHNMSGVLFLIFAIIHIVANRKAIRNHIVSNVSNIDLKEMISALSAVLILLLASFLHAILK